MKKKTAYKYIHFSPLRQKVSNHRLPETETKKATTFRYNINARDNRTKKKGRAHFLAVLLLGNTLHLLNAPYIHN